jgi:hypothetical protein
MKRKPRQVLWTDKIERKCRKATGEESRAEPSKIIDENRLRNTRIEEFIERQANPLR